jgi:zinc and cadmium transporter
MTLFSILLATLIVSLVSLVGILTLGLKPELLKRMTLALVGLAAGALMGGAFLHLLPEALEGSDASTVFAYVLASFVGFFIVERILHWRHCHDGDCEVHTFGHMSLIGDSIHNFIDGLVIAGAFVADWRLGVTTTLAMILHEIPQEIGDYAVLLHAGFGKTRALLLNLFTAFTAIAGGVIGYFFAERSASFESALLPIAAGGFLYIAGSDLLPELRNDRSTKAVALSFAMFLLGIGFMWGVKTFGLSE